jgi:hypothetical protein
MTDDERHGMDEQSKRAYLSPTIRSDAGLPVSPDAVVHRKTAYHRKAFLTYAGYARAWRILTTRDDAPHHAWAETIDRGPNFGLLWEDLSQEILPGALSPRTGSGATSSLSRAWSTEMLMYGTLRQAVRGEWSGDLLRASLPWLTVQAYYASFSATQALVWVATGRDLSKHADVRAAFPEMWGNEDVLVPPFGASVAARPAGDARAVQYVGIPPGTDPSRTDPKGFWTRFGAWDVAAMSLRTTLEKRLDERYADARSRLGCSRLPQSEREKLRARTGPITILDVLHRLRVAANYGDADVFLLGPAPDDDEAVLHFAANLAHITSALLFATEMRIASVSADEELWFVADNWLRLHGDFEQSPLCDRFAEWSQLSAKE